MGPVGRWMDATHGYVLPSRWDGGGYGCTVHGSRCTGHGSRGTVHGARFTVHGSRGTVHGARFTVHGARCTVHGARGTGHGTRSGAQVLRPPTPTPTRTPTRPRPRPRPRPRTRPVHTAGEVWRFWHPSRGATRIIEKPWVASEDGAWRPLVGCDPRLCSAIPLGWGAGHGARGTVHGARCTVAGARCTGHGSRFTVHGSRFTVHGQGRRFFVLLLLLVLLLVLVLVLVLDRYTRLGRRGVSGTLPGVRLGFSRNRGSHPMMGPGGLWLDATHGYVLPSRWDGARYTVHGARCTGHGARYTGHGARYTGHGARYTGHGSRSGARVLRPPTPTRPRPRPRPVHTAGEVWRLCHPCRVRTCIFSFR
jgi:hypothetical protein